MPHGPEIQRSFKLFFLSLLVYSLSANSFAQKRATHKAKARLSVQEIAVLSKRSLVVLISTDSRGNPMTLGSGFFVAPDRIATNYHVVRNAAKVFFKRIGSSTLYPVAFVGFPDQSSDLVLLRVDKIKGIPLKLGSPRNLKVGDPVYVAGNPKGLEGTFSLGNLSAMRSNEGLLQITAPISSGSSGGPVLNSQGEVIGIATSTLSEGQNLNFAIPSSRLVELLKPENDLLAGIVEVTDDTIVPKPRWQLVASGSGRAFYIDLTRNTLTPEHTILVWLKMIPEKTSEGQSAKSSLIAALRDVGLSQAERFSYSMELWEIDCSRNRTRFIRSVDYDTDQVVLRDWGEPDEEPKWSTALPDSIAEAWLDFLCRK